MNTKFNYDDIVQVRSTAAPDLRPGARAWIVGVFEKRPGPFFDKFPEGVVYTIEFEDGASLEVHEADLEAGSSP
jgi:hypothetical protein